MQSNPNFGDFVKENKKLVGDYLDIRIEILRLQLVKAFSKSVGYFIWTMVTMFFLLLLMFFLFLVVGFWVSEMTSSMITGFAVTSMIILVIGALITLLRRILFVNPIVRNTIRHIEANGTDDKNEKTK